MTSFNLKELNKLRTDILVVGSGIAGLVAALEASKKYKVVLLSKSRLENTATWYAQGGIASALYKPDSPHLHLEDTLKAGGGLCDKKAVEILVSEGPKAIDFLLSIGTNFDKITCPPPACRQGRAGGEDSFDLAREGGHSIARIIHHKDATGSEVQDKLVKAVLASENIKVVENAFAVDILATEAGCFGALCYDFDGLFAVVAKATILCTGGAGQLFSQTTNPKVSTGDGIAIAYRAGAQICDMEFVQFHPTSLVGETSPRYLITEALRGEGAYLRNGDGERFMEKVHPLAELAPRDVVAKEIVKQMKRSKVDYVYLDATHLNTDNLQAKFPNIWKTCKENGYELAKDLVPVSPVAHFLIGGIMTGYCGETTIKGLYASGETACSGVHGANRLASNSLLEGVVFSRRITDYLSQELGQIKPELNLACECSYLEGLSEDNYKRRLAKVMMKEVGIIRSANSLKKALSFFSRTRDIVSSIQGFELENMFTLGKLITKSALMREESRGVHYRSDYPETSGQWEKHIVMVRGKEPVLVQS